MNKVYIALGSNLSDPQAQLVAALRAMNALPNTRVIAVSSFYQSQPLGPQDQPDYVNAVACLETDLVPLVLLDELQRIEQEQGRVRLRRGANVPWIGYIALWRADSSIRAPYRSSL